MSLNVIDWKQATAAVAQMEDGVAKTVTTQILPVFQAMFQTASDHIQDRFDAALGNALSAISSERTEAVNDIHGIIDRLGAARLEIPPRS